jgi:hypothetical protein
MEKLSDYDETNDAATRVGKYIGIGLSILTYLGVVWLMFLPIVR